MTIKDVFENKVTNLSNLPKISEDCFIETMIKTGVCLTNPEEWEAVFSYASRTVKNSIKIPEIKSFLSKVNVDDATSLIDLDNKVRELKSFMTQLCPKEENPNEPYKSLIQSCWLIHNGIKYNLEKNFELIPQN